MKTKYTIVAILTIFLFGSCTLTVAPDGSKSATINGEQVLRALEIYATK